MTNTSDSIGIEHFALIGCPESEKQSRRRSLGNMNIRPIIYDDSKGHTAVRVILEQLYNETNDNEPRNKLSTDKKDNLSGKNSLQIGNMVQKGDNSVQIGVVSGSGVVNNYFYGDKSTIPYIINETQVEKLKLLLLDDDYYSARAYAMCLSDTGLFDTDYATSILRFCCCCIVE